MGGEAERLGDGGVGGREAEVMTLPKEEDPSKLARQTGRRAPESSVDVSSIPQPLVPLSGLPDQAALEAQDLHAQPCK